MAVATSALSMTKTFTLLPPVALLSADPNQAGGRRVLFMSGDDALAKSQVGELLSTAGFAAIDVGSLASGGALHEVPGGVLTNLNLIKLD